jgi:hypothetical protein
MRRVTPAMTRALHRAARCAQDQGPRASAAHPDDMPRARVPCAACSATALQRAHRPRAALHRSSPARAAQRASCVCGAPRLPTAGAQHAATRVARLRRIDARAARCLAPGGHRLHVHAPRRAFAARARGVGRARPPAASCRNTPRGPKSARWEGRTRLSEAVGRPSALISGPIRRSVSVRRHQLSAAVGDPGAPRPQAGATACRQPHDSRRFARRRAGAGAPRASLALAAVLTPHVVARRKRSGGAAARRRPASSSP